jgi:hypothetical protein
METSREQAMGVTKTGGDETLRGALRSTHIIERDRGNLPVFGLRPAGAVRAYAPGSDKGRREVSPMGMASTIDVNPVMSRCPYPGGHKRKRLSEALGTMSRYLPASPQARIREG